MCTQKPENDFLCSMVSKYVLIFSYLRHGITALRSIVMAQNYNNKNLKYSMSNECIVQKKIFWNLSSSLSDGSFISHVQNVFESSSKST